MDFALGYVIVRAFSRLKNFFLHWYVDGSRVFLARFYRTFRGFEQTFALTISLKHFFEPLYGDKTVAGWFLSFPFRVLRVIVGGFVYGIVGLLYGLLYLAWVVAPVILMYKIFF